MDGEELKRAFRELFEAQVLNHGDYNRVYAQSSGPGPALLLGYRRTPLELVLCPVDLDHLPRANGDGHRIAARAAGQFTSFDLANVATVADTGTAYQLQSVTGFRTCFEVDGASRIPAGAAAAESGDDMVVLDQGQDAEDFHQFMADFLDAVDAFYQVPELTAIFQDVETLPLTA